MRISRVKIANFRSIKSAEFEPSELNVFVGQNNHGKTNLFEAIEWFYNGSGDLSEIAHRHDKDLNVSVEITYVGVQGGIAAVTNEKTRKSFTEFANGRDEIRVIRQSRDAGKRALWLEDTKEWSTKNFAGFDKAFNDCLPRLQYVSTATRLAELSKFSKKTPIGEMLSGVFGAIMEKSPEYLGFRKQFESLFGDSSSGVRRELDALGEKVREHLKKQFPECTKVRFEVGEPSFDDLLKNFETSIDDGVHTTAAEKGDGMQRALMLAIIKTYSDFRREKDELGKRFLFLIDEAELHLHPTAQRQLKDALLELAEGGDQIFINTHSSVLVADEHAKQSIYCVKKDAFETTVSKVAIGDKPEVVYELLGGSPADLLFPNNFLIVEGRTEFELLTRVIRRFYPDKPPVKIIFAGGDIERQKRSVDALNIAFTPLNQTPVYRNSLVILCDCPNETQQAEFQRFKANNRHLEANQQLFVSTTHAIEESYPPPWKNRGQMSPREKTELGKEVGEKIPQSDFESHLPIAFEALKRCWELAHN